MKKNTLVMFFLAMIMLLFVACGSRLDNESTEQIEATAGENQSTFDTSLIGSTFASGDYEYTVQENGTVYISGYIGTDSELIIPTELDGYSVTGISADAFGAFGTNTTIKSLTIPGQIKDIGDNAFCACSSLSSVTIEEGVESIGTEAFQNDTNNKCTITELNIADSVYKMGCYPFGISNQVSREINGLRYIGNVVVDFSENFDGHIIFAKDTKGIADEALHCAPDVGARVPSTIHDETISLPEGIQYIGSGAFLNQSIVNSFKVPVSVTEIGDYAMQFRTINGSYELYPDNEIHKIYGKTGSAAEQYAASNGLNFVITSN